MPILLLTRPKAQSLAFYQRLCQALGAPPRHLIAPLSVIVPCPANIPESGDLILTSGRAVELAGDLTHRRAYCVGFATAELARQKGAEAISADGDVEALLALLLAKAKRPLTHLRGEDSAGNLVARLRAAGLQAEERVLYRAERLPLSEAAKDLLRSGETVLAPVFSPRAARFLAEDAPRLPDELIAISAAAAAPFSGHPAVEVVDSPDGDAMLRAVLRRYGNLS